jgi:ribosome-binding factor A
MSLRLERVRELLKREIGEVIRREIPLDQAGLITVAEVNITSDLHNATVFVSVLGNAEQRKTGLEMLDKNRKRIQGLVGQGIVLKYTPQLRFVEDDSVERGNRVLKIMNDLEGQQPPSIS